MDKGICGKSSLNKKRLILQSTKNNNHSQYEVPQSIATENNESNIIDYRNIPLTLTGEISSSLIHRNNLTQKQPNISLVEDTEDDDEQFISNLKEIIDKNYKMHQNKENYSIRDLQGKSYSSRKKKCLFSDEDQNLIKRFKKSMNEKKVLCAIPQKLQQSENVTSVSNSKCSMITSSPKIASTVTFSKTDTDFSRCNTNQFLSPITLQKNDQLMTPKNIEFVTETEIVETEVEQLVYCEMYYLTPPQRE
ncbi:unnamed protein product [Lasius platythorax]|uniref:Uncharacterized protein n=1 Tax=Lasius platythorax TaxID=488582 RepID=A0AAV2PC01_9HYME